MRTTKQRWLRRARNDAHGFVTHMILGRVVGTVVATMKNASLDGKRLLVVQPIDRHGRDTGKAIVALDAVGAGTGERVYWCRGKEASFPFLPEGVPIEATVVGIVDEVNIPERLRDGSRPAEHR
jgi:ethanolamine utilization protein EutN